MIGPAITEGTPTREVYWNITHVWVMYVLLIPTLLIFGYGLYRHYQLWRVGMPENRFDHPWRRLWGVVVDGIGQRRLFANIYAGLFHAGIFGGFGILLLGTIVVMIHQDFRVTIMQGAFYLYFQSFILDLFGLSCIAGILMAVFRRYVDKPSRLNTAWQDGLVLGSLLVILLTGFIIEGLRITVTHDPWASWSPVGLATGKLLQVLFPPSMLTALHASLWWFHLVVVLAFIALFPYSKLLHVFTATANIYFRSLEPKGAMLKPVAMESGPFGISSIEQFSWKDLLDLDACTECGRCQDACPAFATDKPLSPKAIILDLRAHLRCYDPKANSDGTGQSSLGTVIKSEALWSCTTCMACMQVCPVSIEQVPKIMGMRRYRVMEEGLLPAPMEQALRNLETRGHPYAGLSGSRLDWCDGLNVRILSETEEAEYLYWVGCSTAFNARSHNVARSLSRLLQRAGVDFGILGETETCSGDPARRMGNEYLFEMLAARNIQAFHSHKVKKIVTTCPHCFNTFKNEYPRLGGSFKVYHHTQLLADLVKEGKLTSDGKLDESVTYHDPCYLGRYNDIYEEPRSLLNIASGSGIIEMEKHRERSFCCGAGGGLLWAEDSNVKRINNERARQVVETGANMLAVACPFCMTMMEDGLKAVESSHETRVLDIAELLDRSNGI